VAKPRLLSKNAAFGSEKTSARGQKVFLPFKPLPLFARLPKNARVGLAKTPIK